MTAAICSASLMRKFAIATVMTSLSVSALASPALERELSFEIPAQPLENALLEFSRQARVSVFLNFGGLANRQAPSVMGRLSAGNALHRLLDNTGLSYSVVGETITVSPAAEQARSLKTASPATPAVVPDAARAAAQSSSSNEPIVEEVIVTAQKREERLRDVPVPVASISAEKLVSNNAVLIQDYYTKIPGINLTPNLQSSQTLSIRGITTGNGNPTVGVMVDDVPYGSSTNNGGGRVVPDIDPGQLARIEVLRGPQGTLYGASSMGGLLKFVTVDPSTDRLRGSVQAGANTVSKGGSGYSLRGSVNLPLNADAALILSGFHREDAGYIDNPVLGLDDVNESRVNGGRVAALWRLSDLFTLKLGAVFQDTKGDGSSAADVALGDLQQNKVRGSGVFERKSQIYTATLNGRLGSFDLVSVTGYNINSFVDNFDNTLGQGAAAQTQFGVPGALQTNDNRTRKFSQEIRGTTPIGGKIDALVGLYYSEEKSDYTVQQVAANPTTGAMAGIITNIYFPSTYEDYAVFGDLTYRFTDRFDVQLGGRESGINIDYRLNQVSNVGAPFVQNPVHTDSNVFTYLLTPRFRVTPDLMFYARFASGYRAGGPNPVNAALAAALADLVPKQYEPDKTYNYELGFKGEFFNALSLDLSVYYIDWKDIQIGVLNPIANTGYTSNGGGAKSQGVELSVEARPFTGTQVAAWVAYNDSEINENFPPNTTVDAGPGTKLPNSPQWTGNVTIDQRFPLGNSVMGYIGGSFACVDDRLGVLRNKATPALLRQGFSSYTKADVRAGASYGEWDFNAYVNNLADARGKLNGGLGTSIPGSFLYIQPRTYGVSIGKTF